MLTLQPMLLFWQMTKWGKWRRCETSGPRTSSPSRRTSAISSVCSAEAGSFRSRDSCSEFPSNCPTYRPPSPSSSSRPSWTPWRKISARIPTWPKRSRTFCRLYSCRYRFVVFLQLVSVFYWSLGVKESLPKTGDNRSAGNKAIWRFATVTYLAQLSVDLIPI